ncbi:hypothetical protein ACFXTO_008219 [Malus domestica]
MCRVASPQSTSIFWCGFSPSHSSVFVESLLFLSAFERNVSSPFISLISFLKIYRRRKNPEAQKKKKKNQSRKLSDQICIQSIMATPGVLNREDGFFLNSPILEPLNGESVKSRGMSIEKKIEQLESMAGTVSNRRSRRWVNDRILLELVPRLNAEEIRGLFAPPPWGDDVPLSAFCMTNVREWDTFRNIDMDKQANVIDSMKGPSAKKKSPVDADKTAVLNAWRRVDCRTREALRRGVFAELVEFYEERVRAFVTETEDGDGDVLILQVQDPLRRLLLHGVCEFYNLVSVTVAESENGESTKMTKIMKKKGRPIELPKITLSHFLKMNKQGMW